MTNGLLVLYKYGRPDVYATVKPETATLISRHVIYTNEGDLPVETVINCLLRDCALKMPDFKFDALTAQEKKEFMEYYAPGYDPARFKVSHMSRILKWYDELRK